MGPGWIDVLVKDGLYVTQDDFRWAREKGRYHLVVKTTEETLTVIQDARELFFGNVREMQDSLERVSGVDLERGIEYEVIAAPRPMDCEIRRV